ncbi:MAG: rod shape-determining protein MreD [Pseudomonadota bacterium]
MIAQFPSPKVQTARVTDAPLASAGPSILILRFAECLPFLLFLLLLVVSRVDWSIRAVVTAPPLIGVMFVYYWTIQRPQLTRPVFAFIIGMVIDFTCGNPIGMSALSLFVLSIGLANQRRLFLSGTFFLEWLILPIVLCVVGLFHWLVWSLVLAHLVSPAMILMQLVVTVFVYPAVAFLFSFCSRYIRYLEEERSLAGGG